MKKNLTEVVFILDRSGSMGGLEADTIGGYNSMMEKQKKEEGELLVSTVLFDDKIEVLHDRLTPDKIDKMTDKEYYVRGCTALLDAIGRSVNHIATIHKYAREEDRPEKTLFIITTDGMENASKEFNYAKVKELVEKHQKEDGWEFIFLGANIDAISVAANFGVDASHAVRYECDAEGTKLNFRIMEKMVGFARKAKSKSEMGAAFASAEMLDEIREDYANRGNK